MLHFQEMEMYDMTSFLGMKIKNFTHLVQQC